MPETQSRLAEAMERHGIAVRAEFVPFSKSRNANADPNNTISKRSLNWRVTVVRNGRDILTTDYQAGIAHCPSYKQKMGGGFTLDDADAIFHETEHGRKARRLWGGGRFSENIGDVILPDPADVLHSLCSDSDVIDCGTFEDWADGLGYDADSRKAEAIYRACLEIALKLRAGLGDAVLSELREAAREL